MLHIIFQIMIHFFQSKSTARAWENIQVVCLRADYRAPACAPRHTSAAAAGRRRRNRAGDGDSRDKLSRRGCGRRRLTGESGGNSQCYTYTGIITITHARSLRCGAKNFIDPESWQAFGAW